MTTPLPTGLSPQMNFWRHSNTPSLPQPPLLPWPCSVWLLLVPTTEENNERSLIRLRSRYSSQHNRTPKGYYKKSLPDVLSSRTGALEKVHTSTRTLFRRREHQLALKSTYSLTKKTSHGIKWSAHEYDIKMISQKHYLKQMTQHFLHKSKINVTYWICEVLI